MTFYSKTCNQRLHVRDTDGEVPTFNVAKSAYKIIVERPKKHKDSWSAMDKRVYILGTTLENFRQVKRVFQVLSMSLVCPGSALCSFSLFMPVP